MTSRLMQYVRSTDEIQKEIDAIHAQAAPVRSLRETLSLKVEEGKKQVKDLSQQILSIELPLRELVLELDLARKKEGKAVHKLPATP